MGEVFRFPGTDEAVLDELRDELLLAAATGAADHYGAVAALFTAGFTLLIDIVGPENAIGAMQAIVDAAAERVGN